MGKDIDQINHSKATQPIGNIDSICFVVIGVPPLISGKQSNRIVRGNCSNDKY